MAAARPGRFLVFGRPAFGDAEVAAVSRVVRSGWVGMGPECVAFEEELASFTDASHAVAVNSCTSALQLSLKIAGVERGDEVIAPSLTWYGTANAALYLGASAVLCDVDPSTLCVTPETVLARLSPRTRAVIPVHFGGLAADVSSIRAALPPNVAIVEDAAHALGSYYADGQPVGSGEGLTCFSFYANKNVAAADGGAVTTGDAEQAERLRRLRQSGLASDAWQRYLEPTKSNLGGVEELGYKMNFTDLQAALARVQLSRQAEFAASRLAVASRYAERLEAEAPDVQIQAEVLSHRHARHLFTVQLPLERLACSRDAVFRALRERDIGASIHYLPLHRSPLYAQGRESAPETDRIADRLLTLPIGAAMSVEDADCVMDNFLEVIER